jgi:hypothetical protein
VRLTTARTGVLAIVLEQVHAAVGIEERDVHRSVRRVCSAVNRLKRPA